MPSGASGTPVPVAPVKTGKGKLPKDDDMMRCCEEYLDGLCCTTDALGIAGTRRGQMPDGIDEWVRQAVKSKVASRMSGSKLTPQKSTQVRKKEVAAQVMMPFRKLL